MDFEEHIDRYLLGEMSESERTDFEMTVRSENLETKVSERRVLIQGVRSSERKKIKEQLTTLEASLDNSSKRITWRWVAAASAAVLILSSVWLGLRSGGSSDLFQAYFEVYPNYEQPVIRGSETISPYTFYEQREYERAIELWDASSKVEDRFYLAMAYLAIGQSEDAISLFKKLPDEHKYKEQTHWYLALAYIQIDDYAEARPLLELVRFEDFKPNEAKALLNDLPGN